MSLSRQMRRRLERRADALVARTLPMLRGVPLDAPVDDTFVVIHEPQIAHVMGRLDAEIVLSVLGGSVMLDEIDRARAKQRPSAIPVIVVLNCGWSTVTWTDALPLVKGGVA